MCRSSNFDKILFACEQHESQRTEWKIIKYMYNYMYIYTCVFSILRGQNYAFNNTKIVSKCNSHHRLECCYLA